MEEWDYLNQQLKLFPGITVEVLTEHFQKYYSKSEHIWTSQEVIRLVESINTHKNTFYDIGVIIDINGQLYKNEDIDKNADINSNALIVRINELEKENNKLKLQMSQQINQNIDKYFDDASV
jgi:hypothetical protein